MIRTALVCGFLSMCAVAHASPAPQTRAAQRRDMEQRSKKAYQRIRKEIKKGIAYDALKMPEAMPELDHFIEALERLRENHQPLSEPSEDVKAALRNPELKLELKSQVIKPPGVADGKLPPELVERIGNREHPTYKAELEYLDKVITEAKALRTAGVPYGPYLDFVTGHLSVAFDLDSDPTREKPLVYGKWEGYDYHHATLHGRPNVTALMKDGKLVTDADRDVAQISWSLERRFRKATNGFFFPTTLPLGYAAFNRVSGTRIHYVGLPPDRDDRKERVTDERGGDANYFALHDVGHGGGRDYGEGIYHRNSPTIRESATLASRFSREVAKVSDPKVRAAIHKYWFDNFHEYERDVSLKRLEEGNPSRNFDWRSPAGQWLRGFIDHQKTMMRTEPESP